MAERHGRHENAAGVSRGVSQGSLAEPGGLPRGGLRVPGPGCPRSGEDVVGDLGITATPLGLSSLWVSPWCGVAQGTGEGLSGPPARSFSRVSSRCERTSRT